MKYIVRPSPNRLPDPTSSPRPVQSGAADARVLLPSAVMVKAGRENFPVAAFFLPASTRRHLFNLYGFARLVDDLGDDATGDRLELLNWLSSELEQVYRGTPTYPLMERLVQTVRRFSIPIQPFFDLIEANRQDQRISAYATFADLRAYCALSADPVGRLVLHVMRAATPERLILSDSICTGLQLVEHWQDVAEDFGRGRVYIPQEDLARFGVAPAMIAGRVATEAFRRLMAFEVARARAILTEGAPLANTLCGRHRLAVAAFVAGGRAALSALQKGGYDVLASSPRPNGPQRIIEFVRTLAELRRA